ncbi:MAG: bifunctional [glutamate--ammonia ligase]-adenylyl-L-tyrosine phosphorylase/[glutamate--ammonia-ligase] adenylyltransferase [Pseudomonadales bacterium]
MKSRLETLAGEIRDDVTRLVPSLSAERQVDVVYVASISDYFYKNLKRDASEIVGLFESGDMEREYGASVYERQLGSPDVSDLDRVLRTVRRREMCRIIYRDLMRLADLTQTTRDLSNLADAAIETALSVHYQYNCERFGAPLDASGDPRQMSVLALGKLGAQELNLSSDIDLVFFYDEQGTVSGERALTHQEFFMRTARSLIASLDKIDEIGFVFRVDMRLRPYGESGLLILHRAAMEKYFIEQGRDWERYAFIKARACAGDVALGEDFLEWLVPFVYRKHLDYGAIDSLREMKRLINYEVDVKGLADDLKLGHGGIREVEFIVQACQIIWGGNEPQLRERKLLKVLDYLKDLGLLPEADVNGLRAAYCFLRDSEHVVQAEADRQTQKLPKEALSRQRLAVAMGYTDFESYALALNKHRETVRASFSTFMSSNRAERETLVEGNLYWVSIWRDPDSSNSIELLSSSGYEDAEGTAARLKAFESRLDDSDVQELGASRIDRLMPVLLMLTAKEQSPDKTLERLLAIIDSISRRTTYVSYLLENLDALKRMIYLCGMSPWVAERLQKFPILLYELSDRVTHEAVFERDKLYEEMRQLMQNIESGDLEAQMDSLRQFKNSSVLKVAVFELLDLLSLMKASDALTDIAEIVLDKAFRLAWTYLVDRHGEPLDQSGSPVGQSFAIVAYGKLGGVELGYGSDLDVLFLHDADIRGNTDGNKSIENSVFFSRLGQRIVHILTSFTRFGVLYEVDLRLRPDGNKGPLVSTFSAYERYLREEAWTWEHQALVRARFVAGNPGLRDRFEEIRRTRLAQPRDKAALMQDVVAMRQKMRQHLEKGTTTRSAEVPSDEILLSGFDFKHGAGAIIDIEFMVQYSVLAYSCEYPELTRWTDKMRILDELGSLGIYSRQEVEILQEAYLAYRAAVHYQWLGGAVSSYERLNQYRSDVVEIWNRHMAAPEPEEG